MFAALRKRLLQKAIELGYGKYTDHITSLLGWSRYETMANEIVELVSSNGYVLDAGCGFGQISEILHLLGVEVVGLDVLKSRLWKSLKADYLCGDCRNLPFRSNTFSAIVGCGVIEHVDNEAKFLKECNRTLKDGGVFFCHHLPNVLSAERLSRKLPLYYKHERFYTKDRIKKLFENCGYAILNMERKFLVPVHVGHLGEVWNKTGKFLEKLDNTICKTPLRAFASSWKVIALKTEGNL